MASASSLLWLTTLKASQLKAIATAIGLPSAGTKPLLTQRLLDSIPSSKFYAAGPATEVSKHGYHRILSIDMGIRNLAYCQIAVPSTLSKLQHSPRMKDAPTHKLPVIEAWNRISIAKISSDSVATVIPSDATAKLSKELFSPPVLAVHAYALITRLVLNPSPSAPENILIERQRFRSMGGSAVQEWTLRVNMFEAMLWAVLETLRARGLWMGNVWAVEAGRVQAWWIGTEGKVKKANKETVSNNNGKEAQVEKVLVQGRLGGTKRAKQGKEDKVALVRKWLEEASTMKLEGETEKMGKMYLAKGSCKMRSRKAANDEEKLGKLDDLADCLLQGMAWVRWEENRRRILQHGPGILSQLVE